jgi:hypothetical protein
MGLIAKNYYTLCIAQEMAMPEFGTYLKKLETMNKDKKS